VSGGLSVGKRQKKMPLSAQSALRNYKVTKPDKLCGPGESRNLALYCVPAFRTKKDIIILKSVT
jgi:hypothetical protein